MINQVGKITIYVNNQEEAKDFWINKAGFVVKFESVMGPMMRWLEVAPNQEAFTTFVLYDKELMKKQNKHANVEHPNIILSTQDIKTTYETFISNGIEVGELQQMPYGKMFSFKDQDNNSYLVRED